MTRSTDSFTFTDLLTTVFGEKIAKELDIIPIRELGRIGMHDMLQKGFTMKTAYKYAAVLELVRRINEAIVVEDLKKFKIRNSELIGKLFMERLRGLSVEEFHCVYLNRMNVIIDIECISKGGIAGTVVDPRIILKHAISLEASGIILGHNHPSGQLQPSQPDIELTNQVKMAANFFNIKLLDHIICSDNGYYSFADEGKL